MNTLQKALIALTAGSFLTVGAQAAVMNSGYAGQPYVGAKVGKLDVDLDNADADNATAYGIYAGYNFDPNFGVEVEYVGTDDADFTINNVKGELSSKTYGAYGTYRYYVPNMNGLYAKGKLGVARTEADATVKSGSFSHTESADDTGVAGGVGIGYAPTPNVSIEGEYAVVDSDSKLMTIGAHFKF